MLSYWFMNKSQLFHQFGLTIYFILRMNGHTNIKFAPVRSDVVVILLSSAVVLTPYVQFFSCAAFASSE